MKRHRFHLSSFLLAGFLATTSMHHAFAFEAEEVAERLKELLARQQTELAYESATLAGDDVTLDGVTVKSTMGGDSIPLGTLVLEDLTEEDDGSFRVGSLAMESFEHKEGDVTISLTDLVVSGLFLPADTATDPFGGAMRYDRMEVARIDVENEDGPIATAENLHADLSISEEERKMDASGTIESFSVDLMSVVESGNAATMLEKLGYEEISGSAVMEGSWNASDGRLTLSRYEAVIDDAGTLSVMLDLAGYTPEFARSMEEMARAADTQESSQSSTQHMAMLALLQQLSFHGAAIRFTDDSFTEKMLDHTAEQQGGSRSDVIAQARTAIPAQLTPFVGSDMAGNIAQAVATFLEDPGNIEISATPENPVPFAMLMAAVMGSPEMLVRQIGLAVTANE